MSPELEKSISLLLKKLERVRDRELPVRVGRLLRGKRRYLFMVYD